MNSLSRVFLTFSNEAVGNGRDWAVSVGNLKAKKPHKITLFGSGRDYPEPPSVGSIPVGATKISSILQGFSRRLSLHCN
jgi:hypothetical protein